MNVYDCMKQNLFEINPLCEKKKNSKTCTAARHPFLINSPSQNYITNPVTMMGGLITDSCMGLCESMRILHSVKFTSDQRNHIKMKNPSNDKLSNNKFRGYLDYFK